MTQLQLPSEGRCATPSEAGIKVRERRERLGLSRSALAERSGVYIDSIYNVETGRSARPRGTTLALLNLALDEVEKSRSVEPEFSPGPVPVAESRPSGVPSPEPSLVRDDDVHARRVALGLSQFELARLAGVDRSSVKRLELGAENTRDTTAHAVRAALTIAEAVPSSPVPSDVAVIRVTIEGVTIEVPVNEVETLDRIIDRIMTNLRAR